MHVAIIMDGNGRWAARRNLPRSAGHRAGARSVDAIVTAAARRGVDTLTLYAFSSANWERPPGEVRALFTLLRRHLLTQTRRCLEHSIRLNVIGRRDRVGSGLLRVIEHSERMTARCSGMHLRIAVDYSAQHSLIETCRRLVGDLDVEPERFAAQLGAVDHALGPATPVDLLIRTGGEQRLSDFLLWECAYAELCFVECLWPDFDAPAFEAALADFARRDRRFGRVAAPRIATPALVPASSSHG
jgi:undecaprenyl diphosphate synthase